MKAQYDDIEINLTTRYKKALVEVGESFLQMMREQDTGNEDCWTWCEITVGNLAESNGLSFYCGGDDDRPDGMAYEVVIRGEQEAKTDEN